MNELNAYDDALSDNIATLQRLLASHQYEEALACMDERLALIRTLTDFSRQQTIASTEMAALVRRQLTKEQELRSQVDAFKKEIATQLVTLSRANKAKSSYRVNRQP